MKGYVWRVAFESGSVKEIVAPNITSALLMTVDILHPEKVVSCMRMERVQTEEIPMNRIAEVTA